MSARSGLAIDQPLAHVDDVLALVRRLRLVGRVRLADVRGRRVATALDGLRLGVAAQRVAAIGGLPARRIARVALPGLPLAERDRRSERAVQVALLLGYVGRVRLLGRLVTEGGRLLSGLALTGLAAAILRMPFVALPVPAVLLLRRARIGLVAANRGLAAAAALLLAASRPAVRRRATRAVTAALPASRWRSSSAVSPANTVRLAGLGGGPALRGRVPERSPLLIQCIVAGRPARRQRDGPEAAMPARWGRAPAGLGA